MRGVSFLLLQTCKRELVQLRDSPTSLTDLALVNADRVISAIKMDQGAAQRQLDTLLNRYGHKHPSVVDVQSQLDTLNTSLVANLDRIVNSKSQDLRLLQQRVVTIEKKLEEGKQDIQEIGNKRFQLDSLEREVSANQKIYDIFFNRFTEAGSAIGLEESNARFAETAVPSAAPVRPRKSLITLLATVGAFVFSVLLAFLLDRFDNSVKSSRQVEKRLGLRLLGVLPLVKKFGSDKKRNLPLSPIGNVNVAGKFAEAINSVRTSLCIERRIENSKIILITSSVPGEGKTTSSVNLAFSFGQQEKVLLIDGDMRRPSVWRTVGLENDAPGLSDLINMSAKPKDCIKRDVFDGSIDVLPAGNIPDHPLELLTNIRFNQILSSLSKYYQRIIIDSAPVNAVSDALVFSKHADAVIYVIKSHSTDIGLVERGVDRLQNTGAKLVGALITQADMNKISSYGGEVHYASFYDSYNYSDNKNLNRARFKQKTYHDTLSANYEDLKEFSNFEFLGKPESQHSRLNIRNTQPGIKLHAQTGISTE